MPTNPIPPVVASNANPAASLKAYIALAGSAAAALTGLFAADSLVGKILTGVIILATAFATYQFPNSAVVPTDTYAQGEPEEYQDGFDPAAVDEEDTPLTFDEAAAYDGTEVEPDDGYVESEVDPGTIEGEHVPEPLDETERILRQQRRSDLP